MAWMVGVIVLLLLSPKLSNGVGWGPAGFPLDSNPSKLTSSKSVDNMVDMMKGMNMDSSMSIGSFSNSQSRMSPASSSDSMIVQVGRQTPPVASGSRSPRPIPATSFITLPGTGASYVPPKPPPPPASLGKRVAPYPLEELIPPKIFIQGKLIIVKFCIYINIFFVKKKEKAKVKVSRPGNCLYLHRLLPFILDMDSTALCPTRCPMSGLKSPPHPVRLRLIPSLR